MRIKAKLYEHPEWPAFVEQIVTAPARVPGALDSLKVFLAAPRRAGRHDDGAREIAVHAKRLLIAMKISRRTFVERCDFVTSPVHRAYDGRSSHELGLPGGAPRGASWTSACSTSTRDAKPFSRTPTKP